MPQNGPKMHFFGFIFGRMIPLMPKKVIKNLIKFLLSEIKIIFLAYSIFRELKILPLVTVFYAHLQILQHWIVKKPPANVRY